MASSTLSAASDRVQAQLILGFPSRLEILSIHTLKVCSRCSPSSSRLRCKGTRRLQVNQRLLTVSATNPNSSGGKSPNEESDVKETSNAAQGPPLLTILAGFFVFFVVCWILGSIVMWLISLILNAPSPK